MPLACSGHGLRAALVTNALASAVVGCAFDCTSRWTTRPNPRPSIPSPSPTTFPSRNSSPCEAAARSLLPKVIVRASATNATGPAVAMDEDVVASAVLSSRSGLQPAAGAVRRPSRTTCFSRRTRTRTASPPITHAVVKASASRASLQAMCQHVSGRARLAGARCQYCEVSRLGPATPCSQGSSCMIATWAGGEQRSS